MLKAAKQSTVHSAEFLEEHTHLGVFFLLVCK